MNEQKQIENLMEKKIIESIKRGLKLSETRQRLYDMVKLEGGIEQADRVIGHFDGAVERMKVK